MERAERGGTASEVSILLVADFLTGEKASFTARKSTATFSAAASSTKVAPQSRERGCEQKADSDALNVERKQHEKILSNFILKKFLALRGGGGGGGRGSGGIWSGCEEFHQSFRACSQFNLKCLRSILQAQLVFNEATMGR